MIGKMVYALIIILVLILVCAICFFPINGKGLIASSNWPRNQGVTISRGYVERPKVSDISDTIILPIKSSSSDLAQITVPDPEQVHDYSQEDSINDLPVMTFNIRHGVDDRGRENLNSIIQEIKASGAKIIALQEVDGFMPRSAFKNQAKEVAKALGYNYIYGETINIFGIKYGNALLSAYPIVEYTVQRLPSVSRESRGLIKANIDIDGLIYKVFVTHLGLNHIERKNQIAIINEELEKEQENIILMGDFNGGPGNAEMSDITEKVIDTAIITGNEAKTFAFYSDEPNVRIDRIYVSQDVAVEEQRVIPSLTSDHSMVLVNLSIKSIKDEGIVDAASNEYN